MKNIALFILMVLCILLMACAKDSVRPTANPDADIKSIIMAEIDTFERENWPRGLYDIEKSMISGDTLKLTIRFSGCGEHDFDLVAWNYFLESNPVQAHVLLAHEPDPCDMIVTQELRFDLTPLKETYYKTYTQGKKTQGTIGINMLDRGKHYAHLVYNF